MKPAAKYLCSFHSPMKIAVAQCSSSCLYIGEMRMWLMTNLCSWDLWQKIYELGTQPLRFLAQLVTLWSVEREAEGQALSLCMHPGLASSLLKPNKLSQCRSQIMLV